MRMASLDLVPAPEHDTVASVPASRRRGNWLRVGAAVVVILLFALASRLLGVDHLFRQFFTPASPTETVHTAAVTRQNLVSTVSATGTLGFAETVNVTPRLSGTLRSFTVHLGDSVQAGQIIATLDPSDLDAQVAQAKIDLQSAQAKLTEAEAPPTQQEIDSAQASLMSAQQKLYETQHPYTSADIQSQQAAVGLAQTQLSAAEHPYTAADLAAQAETVREDGVAITEAKDNLIAVEKSADVSRAVRDAQDQENWYEVAYGATLHAYNAGQASKQKLDEDWSNLMSAKEALATAQAKSESELLAAKNQVASAEATLTAAQQKLTVMKAGPTASDLASPKAALAQAQAKLSQMEQPPSTTDLQVAQLTVKTAQDQLEALKQGPDPTSVALAKLSVQAAQATLDSLEQQESELAITSPITGTVLALGSSSSDSSQSVGVGTSVTPASVLLVIADPTKLQVDATVSEVDVARLKVGDAATLTVPALPNQSFHGTLTRIASQATSNQGVVTYGVTVTVQDPPSALRPGMSADVAIVVGEAPNALQVPVAAVQTAHGQSTVTVIDPAGQRHVVPVTTGLLGSQTIQVTGNLTAGQQVAIDLSAASTAPGGPPPAGGAPTLGGGK
jgi:RND family efflux transporter MFP subunit